MSTKSAFENMKNGFSSLEIIQELEPHENLLK